jgi:adenosylcobinamide amidohydrolase
LLEAGVRTPDGDSASGTATDAVVVAWPLGGDPMPFGGPATAPGWAAAPAVRQAMREALNAGPNSRP